MTAERSSCSAIVGSLFLFLYLGIGLVESGIFVKECRKRALSDVVVLLRLRGEG